MIPHRKNRFINALFEHHARSQLGKNFRKVSFTQTSAVPEFEPNVPVIAIANHSSWWDPMLALFLTRYILKKEGYGIMAEEQLRRYGILRRIGVYSVNRESNQEGRAFLEYTRELLAGTGRLLWIYPQGELISSEQIPLDFKKGFVQILKLFPRVHLFKMVASYDFWIESKPEVVVDFLPLETLSPAKGAEYSDRLVERVAAEMTGRLVEVRRIVRTRDDKALRPVIVQATGTHPVYDAYRQARAALSGRKFHAHHGAE